MIVRSIMAMLFTFFWMSSVSAFEQPREVHIIYPKDHAVVYDKVNIVLDPTEVPYFQVVVGKTEYPIIDTSEGRHAYQGLTLKPGVNKITVRVFMLSSDPNKEELELAAFREISVFSRAGLFKGESIPAGFRKMLFHSREHEASCSGCHELDAIKDDLTTPKNPDQVICSVCHRTLPVGNNVHEPVAVWKCIVCHNPELYPVKYQFTSYEPWTFAKTKLPVKPVVLAVAASELFKPFTDAMVSKNKVKKVVEGVVNHLRHNPGDKVRVEVHSDSAATTDEGKGLRQGAGDKARSESYANNVPAKNIKGKVEPVLSNQALSDARARKLAEIFREFRIKDDRFLVVGMGDKRAEALDMTIAGRAHDRVEIVIYPSEVTVENNAGLPLLKDRERIVMNFSYAQGPEVKNMKVLVKLPKGVQYVAGSAIVEGWANEPKIAGNDLIWELGDKGLNFSVKLSYEIRKKTGSSSKEPEIRVTYAAGKDDIPSDYNPNVPVKSSGIAEDACRECHKKVTSGKFGHEPANEGRCDICHNPHASSAPSLLREPSWLLCTECHRGKTSGAHAVAPSHPTKGSRDPSQPDRPFSCVSCHNPHSANARNLLAHNAKVSMQLCKYCHKM